MSFLLRGLSSLSKKVVMIEADLYRRSNASQRRDAKEIIREFAPRLKWNSSGGDTLLDIGCGTGDVIVDYLVPIMPKNYGRIVGGDLSMHMIENAKTQYAALPKLEFRTLDIDNRDLCSSLGEKFHHVTSFYCLHWVQNQKRAAQNIYDLLLPGGDCLLLFLARNPIFDVYRSLAAKSSWAEYMKDVENFITPYQDNEKPAETLESYLKEAGFEDIYCETRDRVFVFNGIEILRQAVRAVDPFKSRIPTNMHTDYFRDYFDIVSKMGFVVKTDKNNNSKNENVTSTDVKIYSPYSLLVAHATKPATAKKA